MSRVLLLRHGQSTWNATNRWQGRADPPLSESGVEQVREAARAAAPVVTRVWTSPLRRARETAEPLAAAWGVELTVEAAWQERDAGEWTGLTRAEIELRWPGYLAERRRPPGFERDEELLDRALGAVHAVSRDLGGARGVVVSHGGLIRVVERALGAEAPPLPNLGGRELVVSDGELVLGPRVSLVAPEPRPG